MSYIADFLKLNLKDFGSMSFPLPIGLVLTVSVVALCAAAFIITYRKRYTVYLLKSLIRHKALNEESAKTLAELKLSDSGAIKRALSRSGQLTYIVKRVGEVKPDYDEYVKRTKEKGYKEEKLDFDNARFYIPEEHELKAQTIIGKTNISWIIPIVCSAFFLAFWFVSLLYLEELLNILIK